MSAELLNGWYVSANQYDVGPSSGTASAYQQTNAQNVYNTFSALGWTLNAIAGMIGNMMYESCLDPACVYPKSSFPNGGATLEDISNQYALSRTSPAYGLVQWLGLGSTEPIANQLVSYAYRHGSEWYEGQIQMDRLTWEYETPAKWKPTESISGNHHQMTFAEYAASTDTPEQLAYYFMLHYEGTYSVVSTRQANARYWYDYFSAGPGPGPGPGPEPVEGWITGQEFSALALAYNGQYMPYDQYDCYEFVQKVWRDISAVSPSDTLCNPASGAGTNTLWRMNVSPYNSWTFQTTSPDNQNRCPVLWYKDTISNYLAIYGSLPAGALLFHRIAEDGNPPIPSQYAGDGIGNFVHVGIYVGNNQVMQSGGRDSGSIPGGGVHLSTYDPDAWNYIAFVVWVDPTGTGPEPEPPKKYWLLYLFNKNKEVLKNVRNYYSRQL